ncbi:Sodium/hydrogen exchanger family-domain-containing protein [Lasiosphaeria hispida]|uniref:Sodium/hydrogen exchanger family-domain-containing protein n=1 Tax=Lasiosphaeria hispida TaxID=260671 RepID=A0AAJ0HI74_9PEZI|nr:Sodium/hydrogen exchanger family-domain-containing protein [Lasiosphaeria hispida]
MSTDGSGGFLQYHEPSIISILTLISFFFFLAISEWLAEKIFRAGLIGQIVVGLVYGVPIGNILAPVWQETFLALGYLLKQNFLLSVVAALLGVLTPIALSFALLYHGFSHTALEAFIIGTALCSTSLGTTFVVINSASKTADFSQTRIGTVLISVALLDDVCGLVLVSVIHQLRGIAEDGEGNLGWIIGRPVLASGLLAVLTPVAASFVLGPGFRQFAEGRFARGKHVANVVLMVGVLGAFLATAAYAGASVLFGAFLAGTVLSSLPSKHSQGPFVVTSREHGETARDRTPTFIHTFGKYVADAQRYILQPLFFASIGFAIPFLQMWTGEMIWKGVVFAILMACGKLVVGVCVTIWDLITVSASDKAVARRSNVIALNWAPATLLGTAMVARGEIGLVIIQVGLNETPFLSEKAFIIGIWAIVLNTIIGPVSVGVLLKRVGGKIANDPRWGVQPKGQSTDAESAVLREQTSLRPASDHLK